MKTARNTESEVAVKWETLYKACEIVIQIWK